MNIEALRKKTPVELNTELHELLKEQFNLRMQKATGQLKTTHRLPVVRKNIARVKTLLEEAKGGN